MLLLPLITLLWLLKVRSVLTMPNFAGRLLISPYPRYYTWDVPFAEGQMLGDIGLKTRGWGNVSVENNHIDVFIFEFADVLHWLSKEFNEARFSDFAEVISTSMRQLLP